MSRPRTPRPGDPLSNEEGTNFAVVIERGWTDDRIYEAAEAHCGMNADELGPYKLQTWRHCSKQWQLDHFTSDVYDTYWSRDGDGSTTIDVAVWS